MRRKEVVQWYIILAERWGIKDGANYRLPYKCTTLYLLKELHVTITNNILSGIRQDQDLSNYSFIKSLPSVEF